MLILLDGDDTTWDMQYAYDRAKDEYADLLFREGVYTHSLRDMVPQKQVDLINKGIKLKDSFTEALAYVYIDLCYELHKTPDQNVIAHIRSIGQSAATARPRLFPDTIPAIQAMKKHAQVHLYTMGERALQLRKLDQLHIKHLFDRFHVDQKKDASSLSRLLDSLDVNRQDVWIVGNSIRHDINPAIELGVHAILVDGRGWLYDNAPLKPGTLYRVQTLFGAERVIRQVSDGIHA